MVLSHHACTNPDEHHSQFTEQTREKKGARERERETSRHQATDQFIFYQLNSFKYSYKKETKTQTTKC